MQSRNAFYIDGQWRTPSGGARIEVVSPHSEQCIGTVPEGTPEDIDAAVDAARGFPTGLAEPDVLVPRFVELYRQGRFPVDRLVERFPLARIEDAIRAAERGEASSPS
ncbi:aldehyde dehydrogenase family protein [Cupriavidus sp. L7L]|uniref:aldehyde dehydrogenase family protein n=1 Tax=Cupriavidus sp. L7L TaxID=2546443 RepID=UPI0010542ED8|nr:aldehyde dehydrogenase family protein [Cupriavidus sp. L7L]TDF62215.1 aldehyde dehydrogenase family protein [Cupriavidus sp. L7L]